MFNNLARESSSRKSRWFKRKEGNAHVGPFGFVELAQGPEGFSILRQKAEDDCFRFVEEILQPASYRSRPLVAVFDDMSDALCSVADMADCMRMLHPDEKFRIAAEDTCMQVTRIVEQLNTHEGIYLALKDSVDSGEPAQSTDAIDHRVAELLLADFYLSGIHLDASTRKRFVDVNEQCFSLGAQFVQGAQSSRQLLLSQLPDHLRVFASKNAKDGIDGDEIVVNGLLSHSSDELTREFGFRTFNAADPHQEDLLVHLLHSRHHLASLAGFECYADRTAAWGGGNSGSLLGGSDGVAKFLELLADRVRPLAERDLLLMRQLKGAPVCAWDVPYFSSAQKQMLIGMKSGQLSQFFSLGACMHGLALLCEALFGLQLSLEETALGELWHDDVRKLAVSHSKEGLLGYIYLDLFQRAHKPAMECHYTVRGGRQLGNMDTTYQSPIVALQLNLSIGRDDAFCCLSLGEVENLFHEFGHALHSMLGRTRYQHVTGTRCSTDFAEVPSTLLERFAFHPDLLSCYARHQQTGEALPTSLLSRLGPSRAVFAAVDKQIQLSESWLDQQLHSRNVIELRSTSHEHATARALCVPHLPLPAAEAHFVCAPQHRFTHLVGYGAKYYAYLVARSTAALLWHGMHFEKDPLSLSSGQRLRYDLLAHGGERPPSELVANTLRQPVEEHLGAERLVNALISDAEEQQDRLRSLGLSI